MSELYYVRSAGRVEGPFDVARLQRMRLQGRLSTIHQISADGKTWHPMSTLAEVSGTSNSIRPLVNAASSVQSASTQPVSTDWSATTEWYYATADGQLHGPHSVQEIQDRLDTGQLTFDTSLWKEGMSDWSPARSIAEFATRSEVVSSGVGSTIRETEVPGRHRSILGGRSLLSFFKGRRLFLMAGSGAILLMMMSVAFLVWSRPVLDQRIVSGLDDQAGLSSAIGLVVVGRSIERNGRKLSIPESTGTGFLVSPHGDVLTNRHVIEGLSNELKKQNASDRLQIWVYFGADRRFDATVAHEDANHDLAVLKTDARNHKFLAMAKLPQKCVGEDVHAIGFPGLNRTALSAEDANRAVLAAEVMHRAGGFEDVRQAFNEKDFIFSVTKGTISRVVPKSATEAAWIEHNAPINQGNSGGPLVDSHGRVLGINTMGLRDRSSLSSVYLSFTVESVEREIRAQTSDTVWK